MSAPETQQNDAPAPGSAPSAPSGRARRGGGSPLGRHLEGWKVAVLLISVAVLGVALVIARPTEPTLVPAPAYDAPRARASDALERERALRVSREGLPHATRVVGERFRRLNRAFAKRQENQPDLAAKLAADVRTELAQGHAESLLDLRALQTELFTRAVQQFIADGKPSSDLEELGGDFAELAKASWLDSNGELLLSDEELRLLFRVRWGLLTGTHRVHPFGPDLNGFRQYYATLLRHPEGGSGADSALRCLAYVDTLAKIDPTYPSRLARGTLFARLGNYDAAATAFQEQLEISRHDGPFSMLARNYFLFARARSQQEQ